IVTTAWMPFSIHAGMVGTDQVAASTQDQANRARVASFVSRSDVAQQLESFGLSPATAKQRVDAMTQDEINRIAGHLDTLPAGADSGCWVVAIIVIALVIWFAFYKR